MAYLDDDTLARFRDRDDINDEMRAEGDIMVQESKADALTTVGYQDGVCSNCNEATFVKYLNGKKLCRMCAERYPDGLPF